MKDIFRLWNRVADKTYSAVNNGSADPNATTPLEVEQTKSPNYKRRKQNRRFIALLILSMISLGTGVFILLVNPYEIIFRWKSTFAMGGEIFEMWRKPEVEVYLRVYMFNFTNAEDYISGKDDKLKIEEVGPYVYREVMEHSNVTFNDNGTLSTIPKHPLEWQADLSYPLREDDKFFAPNIAYLSIGEVASTKSTFIKMILNTYLRSKGQKPILEMTANEFMFNFTSSLVTLGNNIIPGWIKFEKMGLIDRMYDFDDAYETIFTGEVEGDENKVGLVDKWRGSKNLPQWGDTECANIHMSADGSKFPSKLKPDDSILFYRKSLCRAARMTKIDEGWMNGFYGYKYTFEKDMLDNGHRNPKNKCFCRNGKCLPDGLIDVTECYYGFPIALSYPHFMEGNISMVNTIEGMHPNEDIHRSYVWVEPNSGLPLGVSAKLQINLALGNLNGIHGLKHFSQVVLPLLWFDIRMVKLPEAMANKFNFYINIMPISEKVFMWISLLGVAPLLAAALLIKLRRPKNKNTSKHTPIIWDDNSVYAKSLRRMSLEIEKAKLQSVYTPCEIPIIEHHDSDSPFLNSDKTSSESEEDSQPSMSSDRRPSLIKASTGKIRSMSVSFGTKLQENMGEISKNIKNLANKLSNDTLRNDSTRSEVNIENFQSSDEDNYNPEIRRYSMPGDILGNVNYHMVHSSDDEACEMEIVDYGNEFNAPPEEMFRRQSIETSDKIDRMNKIETTGQH